METIIQTPKLISATAVVQDGGYYEKYIKYVNLKILKKLKNSLRFVLEFLFCSLTLVNRLSGKER